MINGLFQHAVRIGLCFAVLVTSARANAASPTIIPRPAVMEARTGVFRITADTQIAAGGAAAAEAAKLVDALAPATGYRLQRADDTKSGRNRIGMSFLNFPVFTTRYERPSFC